MSNFVPLHCHSHFSILDGLSKPDQIADRCVELGYKACALTDHGSISGCIAFHKAMTKKGIKPILGCELYITDRDPDDKDAKVSHLCILAKNKTGWDNLISLVSKTNEHFYRKPRISLEMIKPYAEGLMAFSGHPGSTVANALFETTEVYGMSYQDAQKHLVPNAYKIAKDVICDHIEVFGEGNFFVESQMIDIEHTPVVELIDIVLRDARETVLDMFDVGIVATGDSHYCRREDAKDQRVLLCSNLKTTFRDIDRKRQEGEPVPLGGFFESDNFHIPSIEDMQAVVVDEEDMETSVHISNMCEEYEVLGEPLLPNFECGDQTQTDYLTDLCRTGFKHKLGTKITTPEKKKEYGDRFRAELAVISKAKLEGYFLIVQDYVNYAREQGQLIGPARGSAGGSLISYLLNITTIDPIKYGLIFERFYNEGRNTDDRVSLPDIDIDFPKAYREELIQYLRDTYGADKVCQIITFGRMMGRSALKEVLRVHNACSYEEMNNISKILPGKEEIEDKMEEDEITSIIQWVLEQDPDRSNGDYVLSDYCTYKDGEYHGDYAQYFEQAVRIEGTFKSSGKHAAGVVISQVPLATVCPMIHDSKGIEKIAGIEQKDLEAMGHVKFDILAVALLDRLMYVNYLKEKHG